LSLHYHAEVAVLAPDDLDALANDIKANGLQQPIVIDLDGQLIDGRNRLAACQRAGVEPEWRMIPAAEAEAWIWSANVRRRQMNKGQIAMIAAVSFLNAEKTSPSSKGGRPDNGMAKACGVSQGTMVKAFLVKQYAADLVPGIIAGKLFLDPAHVTAQARKKEADWLDDGLRLLRDIAPDVADRVRDEEIPFEEAKRQYEDRRRAEHMVCDSVLMDLTRMGMRRSRKPDLHHLRRINRLPL
jgi:hypothetical protein